MTRWPRTAGRPEATGGFLLASREERKARVGLPRGKEARSFYRSARERLADARILLEAGRTTGATYLAGYSVECTLKALILGTSPRRRWAETLAGFRGLRSHDLRWLRHRYRTCGGAMLPGEIIEALSALDAWGTHLRYEAATIDLPWVESAIEAADRIIAWAEGRL